MIFQISVIIFQKGYEIYSVHFPYKLAEVYREKLLCMHSLEFQLAYHMNSQRAIVGSNIPETAITPWLLQKGAPSTPIY